jgi:hypothetical protein
MKNEDISKLVDEFVRRIKLYKTEYGQDEFWNLGLNLYTNELKDWHSAQHFPEESKITKERLTIIMNVLLDAISYMSKKNIKESMKKSELKALIKEVVEESLTNTNQPIDQRLSLIKGKTVSAAYIAGGGYIVITFKDGSRLEIDAKGENKFGVSLDKNL